MKTYKIYTVIMLVSCMMVFSSCEKWLDVAPKAQINSNDLLSSVEGFQSALFGVYTQMGSSSLYGDQLSMGLLSVLAQNYSNTTGYYNLNYQTGRYNYTDATVKAKTEAIWNASYKAIAHANLILDQIDQQKDKMPELKYKLIRGEALGLRAYLHFDLLRLYAPSVLVGADQPAIPYMKHFTVEAQEKLTVNQVLGEVEKDLLEAEQLLSAYPSVDLLNSYLTAAAAADMDNFLLYRQNHFNYWAAKALLARMYMYKGDLTRAASYALEVVNSGKFRFITSTEIFPSTTNADNAFSPELIFSVYVSGLLTTANAYFTESAVGTSTNNRLELSTARIGTLYEISSGGSSDLRYAKMWRTAGAGTYYARYWQYDATNMALRNQVPMIRLSEMYLILAEANNDLAQINTIRVARGLNVLASTTNLTEEIRKEYDRDLYAEGQIFFYYKRKGTVKIPNAPVNANYIFPLPVNEITYGK